MYKGVGWAPRGRLQLSIGLFGVAMSPKTASHRPRQARGPKTHLTNAGENIRPIPPV